MIPHKTGLILSLALVFSLPITASAVEAEVAAPPAAAVATEQPAAQPMSSMQDMMREMRRDRDPSNCKTMPGMGMNMGPGKGVMSGENCKTVGGMHGQHKDCPIHGGKDDKRIDMLEKRMDMMQMMLEMMMRQSDDEN